MSKAKITFQKIVQDSQDYGTFQKSDEHMVSIIHFKLEIKGKNFEDMKVEVRQPFGTDYETEPIEVGKISGPYKGPWNHRDFSELCEEYYTSFIGSQGRGISFGGAANIRMRNNTFTSLLIREIDIPEHGATSW